MIKGQFSLNTAGTVISVAVRICKRILDSRVIEGNLCFKKDQAGYSAEAGQQHEVG